MGNENTNEDKRENEDENEKVIEIVGMEIVYPPRRRRTRCKVESFWME
jgi:hypothetical protein